MSMMHACWDTVGHEWGTIGARLLGQGWGTVGAQLGHSWGTVGAGHGRGTPVERQAGIGCRGACGLGGRCVRVRASCAFGLV